VLGIALLGASGSIGRQTLEVISRHPGRFVIRGLAAGRSSPTFLSQIADWPEARVWCAAGRPAEVSVRRWSEGGLVELATADGVDLVVVATTGMAALPAVLAALDAGRRVALANKETLVTGGHLVARRLAGISDPMAALDRLRPIDSEHSAIWQCLLGERRVDVARLILTASGGPFRGRTPASLAAVTPDEALAHPTWRMGAKITIDSATLVNKAFEVIEAKWLYQLPYSKITAVIHPQSVVHSLVEFADGSYKAQLGLPDMRLPIQYALTYPERLPSSAEHGSPTEWGALEFQPLEPAEYPAYREVRAAAEEGGNRGAVINAADEVAVAAFLAGRIGYLRIPTIVADAVTRWGTDVEPELADIVAVDGEVRTALAAEIGLAER
jgi:1-deoxy-D-xylulose-5-phosphate reductoisomerase